MKVWAIELFPGASRLYVKSLKEAMDALNGMVWQDDGQIVQLEASKRYGEPRAEIEIREAEQ